MGERKGKDIRVVAEGRALLAATEQYQRAAARVTAEVEAAYAPRLRTAPPIRWLILRLQRRRELARRLKALLPDEALYLTRAER